MLRAPPRRRAVALPRPRAQVADEIVKRSVDTMLECIGPDLWEEALLRPMDFGHSFSRTLETDNTFFLRHGEAVAIDMAFSCVLAYVRGHLDEATLNECLDMLTNLGLPTYHEKLDAPMLKELIAREMLAFHPECGWDAAQLAATPTRREVFAAPPQQAMQAAAQQGQAQPSQANPPATNSTLVAPVAPPPSLPEEPPQSPMQCD